MHSKELLKGTLSAIVLKLLAEHGTMYGYEIAQRVKELTGGKVVLKDGSLYPALQKLTADGLLSYREEHIGKRVRKYYTLTKKGKVATTAYLDEVKEFIDMITKLVLTTPKTA